MSSQVEAAAASSTSSVQATEHSEDLGGLAGAGGGSTGGSMSSPDTPASSSSSPPPAFAAALTASTATSSSTPSSSSSPTFIDGNIRSFLSFGDSTTASSSSPTRPSATASSPTSPQYGTLSSSPTVSANQGVSPTRFPSRSGSGGVMRRVQKLDDEMETDAVPISREAKGSGGPKSRGSRLGAQMVTAQTAARIGAPSPSLGLTHEEPDSPAYSTTAFPTLSAKGKAREEWGAEALERQGAPTPSAPPAVQSRNRSGSLGRVAAMAAKLVADTVASGNRDDRAGPARKFSINKGADPPRPAMQPGTSLASESSTLVSSAPFASAVAGIAAVSPTIGRPPPHRQSTSSTSAGGGDDWYTQQSISSRHTTLDSNKISNSEYSTAMTSDSVPVSPTRSLLLGRDSATPSSLTSVAESSSSSSQQTGNHGGPPRVGRLGRLQYNKAGDVSVAGPPDRGWESLSRTSSVSAASRSPGIRRSEISQGLGGRQSSADASDRGDYRDASPGVWRDETDDGDRSKSSEPGDRSDASTSYRSASQGVAQRELLLPALSGVRAAVADVAGQTPLYDSKAAMGEVPTSESGTDVKSRASSSHRSSSRLESRRTSSSADTRLRNLASSPEPIGAMSRHTRDTPSLGTLPDTAIAQLGALPGMDPRSLLNKDGVPLSSKNVLTIALQKAQSAVQLDSSNSVPEAILAYQQAVRLLKEVMERIAPKQGKRNKASREEERRRLKNIHDTYSDRIRLLSMIYTADDPDYESLTQDPARSSGGYEPVSAPFEEHSWADYRSEGSSYDNQGQPSMSAGFPNGISSPPAHKGTFEQSSEGRAVMHARIPSPNGNIVGSPTLQAPRDSLEVARKSEIRNATAGGSPAAPAISIESPDTPATSKAGASTAEVETPRRDSGLREFVENTPVAQAGGLQTFRGTNGRRSADQSSLQPGDGDYLSFSREDDLRTPTTPFFDAMPSLGNDDGSQEPRQSESTPTQPRSPVRTRNGGGSSLPIFPNAPALGMIKTPLDIPHRRSSSASSVSTRASREAAANSAAAASAAAAAAASGVLAKSPPRPLRRGTVDVVAASEASPTFLVSPTTTTGTISQRRKGNSPSSTAPEFESGGAVGEGGRHGRGSLDADVHPSSSSSSGVYAEQTRASSAERAGYDAATRKARSKARDSDSGTLKKARSGSMDLLRSQLDRGAKSDAVQQEQNGNVVAGATEASQPTNASSTGRQRALSQPAFRRPQIPGAFMAAIPPPAVPRISRKVSMPSSMAPPVLPGAQNGLRVTASTNHAQQASLSLQSQAQQHGVGGHYRFPPSPSPSSINPFDASPTSAMAPGGASHTAGIVADLFPSGLPSLAMGAPSFASTARSAMLPSVGITTALPDRANLPSLPANRLLRPFYMMRQLHASMNKGAYLTPRLYLSRSLWVPHGVKLPSLETKCRMLDLVTVAVEAVERSGVPLLHPPTAQPGLSAAQAATFVKQLEELDVLFTDVQNTLAKKLAFLETAPGKKTNSSFGSISSKLTRSLGSGGGKGSKSIDASPAGYFDGLGRVFFKAQALEAHLISVTRPQDRSGSTTLDTYAVLPIEVRQNIEAKLRRSSDFFSTVVLTFVLKDMGLLLDRYLKRATSLGE